MRNLTADEWELLHELVLRRYEQIIPAPIQKEKELEDLLYQIELRQGENA